VKKIEAFGRRKEEPRDINDMPEVPNTCMEIESTFLDNLNKKGISVPTSESVSSLSPTKSIKKVNNTKGYDTKEYNTEDLLVSLYETHDELVGAFNSSDYGSKTAQSISNSIIKVGACIKKLGGEVEKFNPIDHVSGLAVPPLIKNAQLVVERTKQLYSRATIEDVQISENGKTIDITLLGQNNNPEVMYRVKGTITASTSWNGNEAIDYIYTPQSGKMSVKVLEGNKWVDNSNSFKVHWGLDELDLKACTKAEISEFKSQNKEGVSEVKENKIAEKVIESKIIPESEEDLSFTIREK